MDESLLMKIPWVEDIFYGPDYSEWWNSKDTRVLPLRFDWSSSGRAPIQGLLGISPSQNFIKYYITYIDSSNLVRFKTLFRYVSYRLRPDHKKKISLLHGIGTETEWVSRNKAVREKQMRPF